LLEGGAELGDGGDGGEGIVVEFDVEALFERGLKLNAAEGIEVQVFGEAELVRVGVGGERGAADFGE